MWGHEHEGTPGLPTVWLAGSAGAPRRPTLGHMPIVPGKMGAPAGLSIASRTYACPPQRLHWGARRLDWL